jgi:hypothetical protein
MGTQLGSGLILCSSSLGTPYPRSYGKPSEFFTVNKRADV